jgi:hypothetical protein
VSARWPRECPVFVCDCGWSPVVGVEIESGRICAHNPESGVIHGMMYAADAVPLTPAAREMLAIARGAK